MVNLIPQQLEAIVCGPTQSAIHGFSHGSACAWLRVENHRYKFTCIVQLRSVKFSAVKFTARNSHALSSLDRLKVENNEIYRYRLTCAAQFRCIKCISHTLSDCCDVKQYTKQCSNANLLTATLLSFTPSIFRDDIAEFKSPCDDKWLLSSGYSPV